MALNRMVLLLLPALASAGLLVLALTTRDPSYLVAAVAGYVAFLAVGFASFRRPRMREAVLAPVPRRQAPVLRPAPAPVLAPRPVPAPDPLPEPGQAPEPEPAPLPVPDLAGLLGSSDTAEFDVAAAWRRGSGTGLRVPVGLDAQGAAVVLDLGESAVGAAPHVLVVGDRGTDPSHVLRTFVTGLLATHPPDDLAVLLAEGTGTLADLVPAPHVAALGDPAATLRAELQRRLRVLREPGAPVLPHLLVVLGEVAEPLERTPELLDVLMDVGRSGARLRMHLLLATSHADADPLRALDVLPSLRIEVPAAPAAAADLVRGSSAPRRFAIAAADSVVAVVTRAAAPGAAALHQVQPSSLPRQFPVGLLLGTVRPVAGRGLGVDGPGGTLTAPIGIAGGPGRQRLGHLWLRWTEGSGHLAVVGAPRTGRTTTLCTAVLATALTHTPTEVRFLCLDLGGGGLSVLAGLPHVATVVGRDRPDLVRRALALVTAVLDDRDALPAEGEETGRRGHVVLVVDGWPSPGGDPGDDDLTAAVTTIARRGSAHGVHVAVAAQRRADLPAPLREDSTGRLELQPDGVPGRVFSGTGRIAQIGLPTALRSQDGHSVEVPLGEAVERIARAWDEVTSAAGQD
ncbi:FtsK/SpoIIIE domain-containing protein [Kineococcus sp. SYSU DK003]|uniref:FtsK/SpoIIIE domain-containing protein n=1 Tax=Kineococcus sp. SYSU DK003 TaxID=3383124 RepID=UPI003D7E1BF9